VLWRYFGDAHGKPLYTFDADRRAGKVTCVGTCAQKFPPYLATADVNAGGGDWSLIARGPKQRQWAYKGNPLYYYNGTDPVPHRVTSKDKPADFVNDRASIFQAQELDPSSAFYSPEQGWRRAAFTPEQSMPVPAGIELKSVDAANGYGFVEQSMGMSLYFLGGKPRDPAAWSPMYAADLAQQVGDFSIVARADGRRQWAYKGQALYSYRGDYAPGELNGLLAQDDARPALAYQDFMPSSVHIQVVPMRGPLMMTSNGLSVYTQTRYRHGGYDESKAVGTRGCVDDCLRTWKPLLARAHDQSSGFWEIEERADGTRQWAYKGATLYTYVGDKKPGDIEGNRRVAIVYGDPQGNINLELTGGDRAPVRRYAGSGFSWQLVNFTN
jgi:predicted lipoprotein with Yx(FWY)xxD motif